jgi:hypothetical protein
MRRMMTWTAVAALGLACRSDDVDLRVNVIVPAEIPSVSSGMLRMSLWAYDPRLADAPATLVDAEARAFEHVQGVPDLMWMTVRGTVPSGAQYFLSVRGFEVRADGERYILWDGLEGTLAPTIVVMRAVPPPPQ